MAGGLRILITTVAAVGLSSLCCSTLIHISQNDKVKRRLLDELKETGLSDQQASDPLTPQSLSPLAYLDCVWHEEIGRASCRERV